MPTRSLRLAPAPSEFAIPVPRFGFTLVGTPYDLVINMDDLRVKHVPSGVIRTAAEDIDAGDPWLNWNSIYLNSATGSFEIAAPSDLGGDDDSLRPWYGYAVYSYTDDLELLVPKGM